MEPAIRYCTTSDGVSIAYYAMGDGETLVIVTSQLWTNLRYSILPRGEFHRSGHGIGREMRVVRYDGRGSGMSDRSARDFSLEAKLRDLDAVVETAAPGSFAMFATNLGALAAVAYASRHPERVTQLILHAPVVDGAAYRRRLSQWDSLRAVASDEWEQYTLTMAANNVGYKDPVRLERTAMRYREAMDPAAVQAHAAAMPELNVAGLLPGLRMPVLMLWREGAHRSLTGDEARAIASAIPDCQLVHTRGELGDWWLAEDTAAVERFLGVALAPRAHADASKETRGVAGGVAVVLFTDIAGSTALTEQMGDARFRAAARALDAEMREAMRACGGQPVDGKVLGDGVMGVFASAAQAIDGARQCLTLSAASELGLHIGLHAGDVIREESNVYGGAVNIASRICGLCEPGEILVSATVRDLARTSAGVAFEERGEHALKGIADPVRVFAVRPAE